MRLGFISTVNLFATDDPLPPDSCVFPWKMRALPTLTFLVFSHVNCALTVTVNSYDTGPTASGFRIFFEGKRASHQHFWIPCVFSSKTRLAFKVIVNLYDSRPTASTSLVFFIENPRRRNPAIFLGFTFILLSQVQCVLGSQVTVNSHAMMPAPAGCRFFFEGKTGLTGIVGKFQSWNKGIWIAGKFQS